MRCIIRILTLGLTTMLAFAGTASAAGPDVSHDALVDAGSRYADLDASAASEHGAGALDTDANVADPGSAKDGGFFGWLQVGWSSVVGTLATVFETLGQDQPETDGGVEAYVSDDGVDLDASLGETTFDGSAAGDLDGKTFETMATVHGKVDEAKGHVPSLG